MSTLNNITIQLDSIKRDIVSSHTNLKNVLVKKGVEVLPTDKMLKLIDKISGLASVSYVAGDSNIAISYGVTSTTSSLSYKEIRRYAFTEDGTFRTRSKFRVDYDIGSSFNGVYMQLKLIRNGSLVWSSQEYYTQEGLSGSPTEIVVDVPNVRNGDILIKSLKNKDGNRAMRSDYLKVSYDIKVKK